MDNQVTKKKQPGKLTVIIVAALASAFILFTPTYGSKQHHWFPRVIVAIAFMALSSLAEDE